MAMTGPEIDALKRRCERILGGEEAATPPVLCRLLLRVLDEVQPAATVRFHLVERNSGEPLDHFECPAALLQEDGLFDERFCLNLPHGSQYTLREFEDPTEQVLKLVYRSLQEMDKPTRSVLELQGRQDATVANAARLFSKVQFKYIPDKEALARLVLLHRGKTQDAQLETREYTLIGPIGDRVLEQLQ